MSKPEPKNRPKPTPTDPPENYWKAKQKLEQDGKKLFVQKIFAAWCKGCGICIGFCPENVFAEGDTGMPVIKHPDNCTGCRFCEFHCPDFALSIHQRYPDRRKKQNGS